MTRVLIINHPQRECGVHQFGKRIYDLVSGSTNVEYIYREMDTIPVYEAALKQMCPDFILYNWHAHTMRWLPQEYPIDPTKKHYFIFHEEHMRRRYDKYLFFGDYDIGWRIPLDKCVLLPRPLYTYTGSYPRNEVPTIGSFGFGFWNKGYHLLTKLVNETFDRAVLNYHIAHSCFGDPSDKMTREVIATCQRLNTNPGVKLNISREFLDAQQVLSFLAGNDINVFLYDDNGEGISSVIDYALSVKRPIALSDCQMFRHILKDEIMVTKCPIQGILNRGTVPLEEFYEKWHPDRFREAIDEVFLC